MNSNGESKVATTNETPICECKVSSSAEKYDKAEWVETVGSLWVEENLSVRKIAKQYNTAILEGATTRAGLDMLEGELTNMMNLLNEEGADTKQRVRAQSRLERHDIEVEELVDDFVSYQTIYRHLRECLDLDPQSTNSGPEASKLLQRIRSLESRTKNVTAKTLTQYDIGVKDPNILLHMKVVCNECQQSFTIQEMFDDEECACFQNDE